MFLLSVLLEVCGNDGIAARPTLEKVEMDKDGILEATEVF